MEHLFEFLVFFGKVVIVFIFILGLVVLAMSQALRHKLKPDLDIENINEKLDGLSEAIQEVILDKKGFKAAEKERKKKLEDEDELAPKPHIFFLKFDGDIKASAVDELRDEITAILTVAKKDDEAVISIESPGGTVHGYGLAAAQIIRLKKGGLKVTACVDRVAASGGYMMACTAHQILAAPFAIIGSIGVLAQVPNFNRILKKHDVDYEEISSGEYKRTVSLLGEITDKGRAKFKEQIEDTHELFKTFVKSERPQVDISKVATGEYWFGLRAKELNLVDEIMTSDEYLLGQKDRAKIFKIKIQPKRTLSEKIGEMMGLASIKAVDRLSEKFFTPPQL